MERNLKNVHPGGSPPAWPLACPSLSCPSLGPCPSDSLACSDQLETATQSLAAICPRSLEDKGVVYHIAKGTGKEAAERPFQHLQKLLERVVSRTDIFWTESHIALTVTWHFCSHFISVFLSSFCHKIQEKLTRTFGGLE